MVLQFVLNIFCNLIRSTRLFQMSYKKVGLT
jgi:hypothetical protein